MDLIKEQLVKDMADLKQHVVTVTTDLGKDLKAEHAIATGTAAVVAGLVKEVADLSQQLVEQKARAEAHTHSVFGRPITAAKVKDGADKAAPAPSKKKKE
jgi:hypothetical protein